MRFRWSLRTQMIAVLFVGLLSLIWHRRNAWSYEYIEDPRTVAMRDRISPDRTRVLGYKYGWLSIFENPWTPDDPPLLSIQMEGGTYVTSCGFSDDHTIVVWVVNYDGEHTRVILKRRYPEGWVGYLFRPEVWLLPLWLGLIVWTIRKDRMVHA